MSVTHVICTEADHVPAALVFPVQDARTFDVVVLRTPSGVQSPLRRIVLRATPPTSNKPDPNLLLRCELVEDPEQLRVVVANPTWPIEASDDEHTWVLGTEDLISADMALVFDPLGTDLSSLGRLHFTLAVERVRVRGLDAAVGASDWQRSPAQDVVAPKGWHTPDLTATLADPVAAIKAWFKAAGAALGKYKTTAFLVLPYAVFLGSGAILYELGAKDQKAAEQKAADLEVQLTAAQQGLAAAQDAQTACLASRTDLAGRLGDKTAAAQAAAATALDLASTQQRVAEEGKDWVTVPELKAGDALLAATTTDAVASQIMAAASPPTATEAQPCLAQEEVLKDGVPRYILTWSPDESLFCPDPVARVLGGVPSAGRWSLNARIQRDFGPAAMAVSGDPLLNDRWSAFTLANGVLQIREAILTAEVRGRAPVSPAQADLWALTLLDATDHLPSVASGALDLPTTTCVQRLMADVDRATRTPGVGEPVLPDLIGVAKGAPLNGVASEPGCPWPTGVFEGSAGRALLAVGRLAEVAK